MVKYDIKIVGGCNTAWSVVTILICKCLRLLLQGCSTVLQKADQLAMGQPIP